MMTTKWRLHLGRTTLASAGITAAAIALCATVEAQDRVDEVTRSAAEIQGTESFGQPSERTQPYRQGYRGQPYGPSAGFFEDGYQEYGAQQPQRRTVRQQDRYQDQPGEYGYQREDWQTGQGQERGGLGIVMRETDGRGVQVVDVYEGSPADQVGLREGDRIVAVDGQQIRSVRELQSQITQQDPGSQIEVVAIRNGQERSFQTRLESRQEALSQGPQGQQQQPGQRQQQMQDRQVQTRLASLERQLQQILSEVRSLQQQVGGPQSRQAWRTDGGFQQGFQSGRMQEGSQGQMQDQYDQGQQRSQYYDEPGTNQRSQGGPQADYRTDF